MDHDAVLILEDGTKFRGRSFGHPSEAVGETVFTTGMVGYPESMTDPSYAGQILTFTYPLIGSYGVPDRVIDEFGTVRGFESDAVHVSGIVVHALQRTHHHHSAVKSLDLWMKEQGIPGIEIMDTRTLTKKIREKGTMMGKISFSEDASPPLDLGGKNPVKQVSIEESKVYLSHHSPRVVLIDCGVKESILRSILSRGIDLVRVPYHYPFDKILAFGPSGIVVSNGPGNPRICTESIQAVREAMETEIPILGICLGHQILALAAGAETYKLKFGHRGQNHPCIDTSTGKCYITSQNHGFAVDASSVAETDFAISFMNANDKTTEGIVHTRKPVVGVQFHPEASPGPLDTGFLFDIFAKEVNAYEP